MKDDRKFATAKMNKPMTAEGLKIEIDVSQAMRAVKKLKRATAKRNFRKLLYIIYIPLLILDWIVTLLANIMELICNSIKELALHLETYINNANKFPSEPET